VGGASGVEIIARKISVNADCTGAATINVFDGSGSLLRSAVLALVYVNDAREIRLIFTSLVQADGANLPVVITVDGNRLFPEDDH
jgi:hypothetical protein